MMFVCMYVLGVTDPSNAHSLATVRVVDGHRFTARDLLAFTRMQNHVAKSAMLVFSTGTLPQYGEMNALVFNFVSTSERA